MKTIDQPIRSQFKIRRKHVNKKRELQSYYLYLQIEDLAKRIISPYHKKTPTFAKNTSIEIKDNVYLQDTIYLKGFVEFHESSTMHIFITVYRKGSEDTTIISEASFSYAYSGKEPQNMHFPTTVIEVV